MGTARSLLTFAGSASVDAEASGATAGTAASLQTALLQLILSTRGLADDSFVLVLATIAPSNRDFDATQATLRYIQYLQGSQIEQMGTEEQKGRKARRLWQSKVNLEMLGRLKAARKNRQVDSDNMLKSLDQARPPMT